MFRVITGDCLAHLGSMVGVADTILTDPPYNQKIDYGSGSDADAMTPDDYLAWSQTWLGGCVAALKPGGTLWVVCPDEWAGEFEVYLRRKLRMERRNWVKWYETFGTNQTRKFNRTSRHLLYFVKTGADFYFNPDPVRVPSARLEKYGDKRANPKGKLPDDVWTFPRVAGTFLERVPEVPTQLPVALVRRALAATTRLGETVIDPFLGSGTTGVVAVRLGYEFVGIEKEPATAVIAERRIRSEVDTMVKVG